MDSLETMNKAAIKRKNIAPQKDVCLHELFEAQVDIRPQALAVQCETRTMTYLELEHRANQLAHYLRTLGVGPGAFVGIYLERSEKHILALLAILKAGAAYVPIDSSYPRERVKHILKDAKIAILITEQALLANQIIRGAVKIIVLDAITNALTKQPSDRISCEESGITPQDLCYIIYTSGTTGQPKGIMTEHRNVVHFLPAFNKVCQLNHRDRVYQGFSLGFDGSVEEIWMAFAHGASLIVGTQEIAGFAEASAQLMNETGVTFFSTVPTFLSMIKTQLTSVRLIVVSGEQCPPELVAKWVFNGRRMLNVYGPTETTVNTTSVECKPQQPITIGKPLEGYTTYILDANGQRVKPGASGELYIGGGGVARGYLNQQALTEQYFLPNPFNGSPSKPSVFYRTGDLVRLNENQDLVFLERIDNQVKIRGFRIELSEIESVLSEHPDIHQAIVSTCAAHGNKELAAFIVKHDPSQDLNRNTVLDLLQSRLPSYMIPAYLDVIDKIPTLTSGKVDRKQLPSTHTPLVRIRQKLEEPESEFECQISDLWKKIFSLSSLSTEDNFFFDLGGHSLLAAQLVTQLRKKLNIANIAIQDIYQNPTVKQLASHLHAQMHTKTKENKQHKESDQQPSGKVVYNHVTNFTRYCTVTLQALSLFFFYGFATLPFVALYIMYTAVKQGSLSLTWAIGLGIGLFIGLYPTLLGISIIAKWLIIGRYKPGKYPVWGWYYFRWWLVSRFHMFSGAGFLEGTPLINLYFRLMGAKIGKGCLLDTSSCSICDLLSIGANTSIGSDTSILGYKIVDGWLIMGPLSVGADCFIGMHSSLGIHTNIGDNARLDDLSLLADGETIQSGESLRGSPAKPGSVNIPKISKKEKKNSVSFIFGTLHFLSIYMIELFLIAVALPSGMLLYSAYLVRNLYYWLFVIIACVPLFELCFCLFLVLLKKLILPHTKPGVYSTHSFFYLRKWYIDSLFNLSRIFVLPIYTTLYLPTWLRMLGAKIGKRVELSIVGLTTPSLFEAKEESFFADGSIIGGNRYYQGHFEITKNIIGRRSFIGNNAIVPNNVNIGNECLIGVLSMPPVDNEKVPNQSEWLGSPPFPLPNHQKVEGFTEQETYKPTKIQLIKRLLVDSLRIIIPSIIEIYGLVAIIFAISFIYTQTSLPILLICTPLLGLSVATSMALMVVVVKNLIMGEYKPTIKPLWSSYVWFNEVINGAYEAVGAPMLSPLLGTPFFSCYLRLLGCKIGKYVYIGTTLLGEFDLVEIGDYAAINAGVVIQNHLFEDRIFKAAKLKIGTGCSLGNNSIILYDTEMLPGSSIDALSLLMKGEILPQQTSWYGIPTVIVNAKTE